MTFSRSLTLDQSYLMVGSSTAATQRVTGKVRLHRGSRRENPGVFGTLAMFFMVVFKGGLNGDFKVVFMVISRDFMGILGDFMGLSGDRSNGDLMVIFHQPHCDGMDHKDIMDN